MEKDGRPELAKLEDASDLIRLEFLDRYYEMNRLTSSVLKGEVLRRTTHNDANKRWLAKIIPEVRSAH